MVTTIENKRKAKIKNIKKIKESKTHINIQKLINHKQDITKIKKTQVNTK